MHYKNGREAKEGDTVIASASGRVIAGILVDTNAQSDTCNGQVVRAAGNPYYINIKDAYHVEDAYAITDKVIAPPTPPTP